MMPVSDDMWRVLVNSLDALPDDGTGPPEEESIKPFAEVTTEDEATEDVFFVQKVVTEMYIFTNSKNQTFGEHTFQDMVILGEMPLEKLTKLLNRQKKKREKGS